MNTIRSRLYFCRLRIRRHNLHYGSLHHCLAQVMLNGSDPMQWVPRTGVENCEAPSSPYKSYRFWAGSQSNAVFVRKLKGSEKYVIVGSVQPQSNVPSNAPANVHATVRLPTGGALKLELRRQVRTTTLYPHTHTPTQHHHHSHTLTRAPLLSSLTPVLFYSRPSRGDYFSQSRLHSAHGRARCTSLRTTPGWVSQSRFSLRSTAGTRPHTSRVGRKTFRSRRSCTTTTLL